MSASKPEIMYTIECLPEDLPVRGNAISSGDDEFDRRVERGILARLDRGEVWAWCSVRVVAEVDGFEGESFLGSCSYVDEDDFRAEGGYFEQMKDEAKEDLRQHLITEVDRGEAARKAITELFLAS